MFDNAVPLHRSRHAALRYVPQAGHGFAARSHLVPMVAGEAEQACAEFVIVFPAGDGLPLLLTGVQPGVNACVDESGRWKAKHVPRHVRQYPFALAERPLQAPRGSAPELNLTLCVVPDAPHFQVSAGTAGRPLFKEDGSLSEFLLQVQKELVQLRNEVHQTAQLVRELDQAGVLREGVLPVVSADEGRALPLRVGRVIDAERLQALSAEKRESLERSGALKLALAHARSLRHLSAPWLVGALAAPAGDAPALPPGAGLMGRLRDGAAVRSAAPSTGAPATISFPSLGGNAPSSSRKDH